MIVLDIVVVLGIIFLFGLIISRVSKHLSSKLLSDQEKSVLLLKAMGSNDPYEIDGVLALYQKDLSKEVIQVLTDRRNEVYNKLNP